MFIVARKYFVQAPLGATSANSGCRPAGAKNSTQPYCYKHFAPPGLAPQNPLAPGTFILTSRALRRGSHHLVTHVRINTRIRPAEPSGPVVRREQRGEGLDARLVEWVVPAAAVAQDVDIHRAQLFHRRAGIASVLGHYVVEDSVAFRDGAYIECFAFRKSDGQTYYGDAE